MHVRRRRTNEANGWTKGRKFREGSAEESRDRRDAAHLVHFGGPWTIDDERWVSSVSLFARKACTNLEDLTPAETELVLGGGCEVVLRYRLHSSSRRRETGDDEPLLLEGTRGRSLYDISHCSESAYGVLRPVEAREGKTGRRGGENERGREKAFLVLHATRVFIS